MKIRFVQTLATTRECFRSGREYDLDDVKAVRFIGRGIAVAVEEQPPADAPRPKRTRRPKGAA